MKNFITTDEQLHAVAGVNDTFGVDVLAPDLELVLSQDVRPLLGDELVDELLAAQAADTLTDAQDKLVYYLQGALANLALVEYLPLAQVQLSQMGVALKVDKTAFLWQIRDLRASFVRKGYNYLERALTLLDKPSEADFEVWRQSAAGAAARQYLLSSARDFSEWCNIGASRLVFNALLPSLRKVEAFDVAPTLGPEFYQELKQQARTRSLTLENALLLSMYVQPALASLTVAKAVPEVGLSLNGQALELNVYRFDDAAATPTAGAPLAALLEQKVQAAQADGHRYLQLLRGYLNREASPTRFATYFNSNTYQPAGPRPVVRNDEANPAYFAF